MKLKTETLIANGKQLNSYYDAFEGQDYHYCLECGAMMECTSLVNVNSFDIHYLSCGHSLHYKTPSNH